MKKVEREQRKQEYIEKRKKITRIKGPTGRRRVEEKERARTG